MTNYNHLFRSIHYYQETSHHDFRENSEVFASELLENRDEMFPRYHMPSDT